MALEKIAQGMAEVGQVVLSWRGLTRSRWLQEATCRRYSANGAEANGVRSISSCPSSTPSYAAWPITELRSERVDHTLQPTALVHEVYIRLVDQRRVTWHDRAHFFGVAAQLMRRILVDHARRHAAAKRGDGALCVSVDDVRDLAAAENLSILTLDHALSRLNQVDPGLARVVELRAFGGLTIEEAAQVLDTSPSTVKRNWRMAKAWLTRELASEPDRE